MELQKILLDGCHKSELRIVGAGPFTAQMLLQLPSQQLQNTEG